MDPTQKLLKSSFKLCQLLDKTSDSYLPIEISNVVKLHAKLAVASAWIPVPGADIAAGAATIWSMYIRINKKINMPFSENIVKTIASGVCTNLAGYAAGAGVASALKFIPGLGTLAGGIVMSAALYAITLTSGYIYLQALINIEEKRHGSDRIDSFNLENTISSILKDKDMISEFISDAKNYYKANSDKIKVSDLEQEKARDNF